MTRWIRSLIAMALVVLGLSVVGGAAPAFACSCARATIQKSADASNVVFRGTLVAITPPAGDTSSTAMTTYAIQARTAYKGAVDYNTEIQSEVSGASCGLEGMEEGTEYVFFATGTAAPYHASLCGGTEPVTPERLTKIEQVLGEGTAIEVPPLPAPTRTKIEESPPASFSRMAAPGAAVVVLGLLGLLLVGRLSRR